ncbi:2Fe-2S iron-sulfur cluster-binding protein [Methylobacterium nonmethylotrophicum]|uniref:2Fe-2S iron-sulfur cluster binding domain-containing protein n=1 Tax=Methylobacterium nonmethylotrophicum TaxID=1141884 RepID=A0A4Z0NG31_9HYPH|nr:2Fe-2S iron-sulfur cluster-binding protein [Methylobacterium nonmethylotrophicum]TGD95278.1 2Fe-2S iron-sulfur cluster binding domain-containing protein [Methylobacterium nonmethylotrophicum]
MPMITFIRPDGGQRDLSVPEGTSLMQGATTQGLDGIVAECGGNAMCATCHVYVDEAWTERLPPLFEDEDALLEGTAAERRPTSRLSCQVIATADLDGLVVRLPDRQV